MTQLPHTTGSYELPSYAGDLPPLALPPWDRALVGAARSYTSCHNGTHRGSCPLAPAAADGPVGLDAAAAALEDVDEWDLRSIR